MPGADTLLVLTYHAIDDEPAVICTPPALFRRQMETLAGLGLEGVSLAEAFRRREQTGRFPERAMALTFDDGYLSVFEQAMPVLRRHGFGATVFVVSGAVGLNARQARKLNRHMDRDMIAWEQLAELADDGIEIGSHTVSHPDLRTLGREALAQELDKSRDMLQQRLHVAVDSFAYPYGRSNRAVREAAASRYRIACTTRLGRHKPGADVLQIRRVDAWYLRRPAQFERLVTGRLGAYLALRQAGRNLKQALQP
jgi:peptidoglycan/xylan/chitin deacetylase (PgdA/CDA1 family)